MASFSLIDRQGQISEKLAKEKPGARVLVDQHSVFANPAQA
tara:strand:- start:17074 stop:17196 length:123 start_codon:yes stop_codon:yes gene_type:complete